MRRSAVLISLVLSACRVDCGPQPVTPHVPGKADRDPPPDIDREREQAQWDQAYGASGGTANISGGVIAGMAAAGVLTGAGVAVALHDGGAPPQPADENR